MKHTQHPLWLVLLAVPLGFGCPSPEPAASPDVVDVALDVAGTDDGASADIGTTVCDGLAVGQSTLALRVDCADALTLFARVQMDGQWESPGACSGGAMLSCPFDSGVLTLTPSGDTLAVAFNATGSGTYGGFELAGSGMLPGATSWLSDGFQSWSQAGVLALGDQPSEAALEAALTVAADEEVLREGTTHGYWKTWVAGGPRAWLFGALSADHHRAWIQVYRGQGDTVRVRLVSGGVPADQVAVAAGDVLSETWMLLAGDTSSLNAMDRRYGEALAARARRAQHPVPAEAGWNSWYDLWDSVDADAVSTNASLAAAAWSGRLPTDAPPLRIVIDDGWQVAWGEWEPNAKFPDGLDGLAAILKADGFEVGVWLAPLLVDGDSALVSDHPDWFVDGATYNHAKNGVMRVLDVTHADARAHLASVISTIVGWGYDFLKIDFLFAGTQPGTRAAPIGAMASYHLALQTIREAAGDDVILLAVGAPGLPSLPHVDSWRVGYDIALEPFGASWFFVPNQARSIASRWSTCLAVLCDAGPPILRELDQNEVDAGGWVAALPGGALFLSDDLRQLPSERHTWGLGAESIAHGIGGTPAWPVNPIPDDPPTSLTNPLTDHLISSNAHWVPTVWELPDGSRVALNLSDEPLTVEGTSVAPRSAVVLP